MGLAHVKGEVLMSTPETDRTPEAPTSQAELPEVPTDGDDEYNLPFTD